MKGGLDNPNAPLPSPPPTPPARRAAGVSGRSGAAHSPLGLQCAGVLKSGNYEEKNVIILILWTLLGFIEFFLSTHYPPPPGFEGGCSQSPIFFSLKPFLDLKEETCVSHSMIRENPNLPKESLLWNLRLLLIVSFAPCFLRTCFCFPSNQHSGPLLKKHPAEKYTVAAHCMCHTLFHRPIRVHILPSPPPSPPHSHYS